VGVASLKAGAGGSAKQGWSPLRWSEGAVVILDQRELPARECYRTLRSVEEVAEAIESLAVRGAPAIGCAAAMAVALGAATCEATDTAELVRTLEDDAIPRLAATRPTAVNLFWALGRVRAALSELAAAPGATPDTVRRGLVEEAERLLEEDRQTCEAIGRAGLPLVPDGARVLTHCNAGALATAGAGTALGVLRAAVADGRHVEVLADETRPLLQGARLTAWELQRDDIPVRVCTDGMAGHLMQRGEVDLVIVGADRIAANGDVANKIGTYGLAVLADAHELPFYVAAPLASVDLGTPEGAAIPIEERDRDEVARIGEELLVPDGVDVFGPAFDVTPARLVTALITERGILRPPYTEALAKVIGAGSPA
jgi:methylthioribose-1-phosphate isomerase